MRSSKIALFTGLILSLSTAFIQASPLPEPWGNQLLVSVSEDWTSFHATLYGFSRSHEHSAWKLDFTYPAVLGSKGMGWGLGIHGWTLDSGPVKHEGDRRSPAGVFHLPSTFGYVSFKESGITSYPYLQLTENTLDVDDPSSPFYNQIVDRSLKNPNQWHSAEIMLRPDGAYRLGVFIAHNDSNFKSNTSDPSLPVAGTTALGSCIFLHIWRSESSPTIGCTALAPENMEHLVHWLKKDDNPLLVQLPLEEYKRFQKPWNLPDLPSSH